MSESNPFEGLFPGDYFIQRLTIDGKVVHAYGFLKGEDHAGKIYANYQCRWYPSKEFDLSTDDMKVVGRISLDAYKLAKLRNWPVDDSEVLSVISFSGGNRKQASVMERIKIKFMTL